MSSGGGGGADAAARRFGLVEYDSPDLDYSFLYPKGWRSLRNHLRRGVIVSDFQTTDKVYVEVFSRPPRDELLETLRLGSTEEDEERGAAPEGGANQVVAGTGDKEKEKRREEKKSEAARLAIRTRAVEALIAPVDNDNSGDSKLEMPSMRNVKSLDLDGDGGEARRVYSADTQLSYDYFTFTSETTTRQGTTRVHPSLLFASLRSPSLRSLSPVELSGRTRGALVTVPLRGDCSRRRGQQNDDTWDEVMTPWRLLKRNKYLYQVSRKKKKKKDR